MDGKTKMQVTFIDPDRRALYVGELPEGGWCAWSQKGKDAPRRLRAVSYFDGRAYESESDAQNALRQYVGKKRSESSFGAWDVYVNGKHCTFEELNAMQSGHMQLPTVQAPAALVSLANIEYRIATHMQGAYENLLQVGRCLNEAKESGLVAHGEWEAWVRKNTNMSERQAQRLMQAARSVDPGSAMERLPITKIQAILSLPEPEREPMAERAAAEGMSLRELQDAVKAEKARADALAEVNQKANSRAAKAERELGEVKAIMQQTIDTKTAEYRAKYAEALEAEYVEKLAAELDRLTAEMAEAQDAAASGADDSEARAEIERLKAELAEAEEYAEQQAEQRQQAQREMLALRSQSARGEIQGADEGMSAIDLAAAVRTFIGSVGVLPHMGAKLAALGENERQEYRQYIDMVRAWVLAAQNAVETYTAI